MGYNCRNFGIILSGSDGKYKLSMYLSKANELYCYNLKLETLYERSMFFITCDHLVIQCFYFYRKIKHISRKFQKLLHISCMLKLYSSELITLWFHFIFRFWLKVIWKMKLRAEQKFNKHLFYFLKKKYFQQSSLISLACELVAIMPPLNRAISFAS